MAMAANKKSSYLDEFSDNEDPERHKNGGGLQPFSNGRSLTDEERAEIAETMASNGTRTETVNVRGNTGDPFVDDCKNNPDTKEHTLMDSTPDNFKDDGTGPDSTNCVKCEEFIAYRQTAYKTCMNCDHEYCTSCVSALIESSNSSNSILPFIIVGDIPVLLIVSCIVRLLCNKVYRDALLSVYYLYKSPSKK
jgi:hypothetical protein